MITFFDWRRVVEVMGQVRFAYIWPAPALLAVALYFGGVRWSILLPYFGIRLKASKAFLYYLIGSFYGNALPGVIGGDAVRIGICGVTEKKPVADITASVLVERVWGVLALLAMGTMAIIMIPVSLRSALGPSVVILVPVMAGVSLFILFGGYLILGVVLVTRVEHISGRSKKIAETILRVIGYTRKIPPASMTAVFLLSAFFQFADIMASFLLAKAINIDVPFTLFFAIFPIVYIVTALPISLGGLGVREGALTYFLNRVGVLPSDAVMLSFIIYLNRILVSLIGGALQIIWKPAVNSREAGVRAQREEGDIPL